jgi:MFS family permease
VVPHVAGRILPAAVARPSAAAHVALAAPWFAYNVQWGALLPIVIPAQIAGFVPQQKELALGLVMDGGALIALVVTPLAGAWSDRLGDRRGIVLGGAFATVLALLVLGALGTHAPLPAFVAAVLALQLTTNVWGGPYAATIPDRVPREARGIASAWMMVMTVLGTVLGAVVCGVLVQRGAYFAAYAFIAAVLAATMIAAFAAVYARDGTAPERAAPGRFFPPLREHRAFYTVLVTRALVTMGIYSVYEFFLYFLGDVVHVRDPIRNGSLLLAAAALTGVPAALLAGRAGDRTGPVRVVVASSAAMAAIAALFVVLVYHPSWPGTVVLALLYGAASCAYQAVDWALATHVLPSRADAGKDMGIWHVSFVLPQMIAPGLTGLVIAACKPVSITFGYAIAFGLAAVWFALGCAFVARLRVPNA